MRFTVGLGVSLSALLSVSVTAAPVRTPGASKNKPAASDTTGPVIDHVAVTEAEPSKSFEIVTTIRDASGVAFPNLYYRTVGKADFNQTTLVAQGDRFVAIIPAFSVTTSGVEYYVEAFDKLGNGPVYHGTKMKPHRIAVRLKKTAKAPAAGGGTAWYKRWWVWTIAGAVVAGSVAAIVVATSGGENGLPPAGGATLVIDAPAPAPTLPGLP